MKRPTIALCLISKDEAHNLPVLAESIKDCFDEVHLTDTGSTDNTVEIAKSYGWKIHNFKWVDDFSAARNYSFSHAKTDFVMWLDCDDSLGDRAAFIRWRNDAMAFADFWVAAYHYASDPTGKPVCSFVRERAFRVNRGFQWRYFVHEGVVPVSSTGLPVAHDYTNQWSVIHRRTVADLAVDRSRNLRLLELNSSRLDGRMKYYYGKELFENGKPMDGFYWLKESLKEPNMEPHDKMMAFQYAAMCAAHCQQFQNSIDICHEGLKLAPARAEFMVLIGDGLIKLGKMLEAAPWYEAARMCPITTGGNNVRADFLTEAHYTTYPSNMLSRIWANAGQTKKAHDIARDAFEKWGDPETKQVVDETARIMNSMARVKSTTEDIVFTCPGPGVYEWDMDISKTRGMGGSETACIEMAHALKRLTRRPVKIFNMRSFDRTIDGVEYISNAKLGDWFGQFEPHTHIAWRHNLKLTDAKTYVWGHDLVTPGSENHTQYEKMLCLTPFHKRFTQARTGIPDDKIIVTRNGLKPDLFSGEVVKKDPNKIVFPSSPDRGLDRAMRIIDRVIDKYPEMRLHVFYGFDNLYKYGLGKRADEMKAMIAQRPWVVFHGFTPQNELIKHYKEASVWLHPCDFIETSCITAMEMLCAGVYPVTRRLGGLQDTLADAEKAGMCTMLDHDCLTEMEYASYTDAFLDAYVNRKWEKVDVPIESHTWEKVASSWIDLMKL